MHTQRFDDHHSEPHAERPLFGRNLVWWAAAFGIILAISRGVSDDDAGLVFDPEGKLRSVVATTYYWPRRWRSKAHKEEASCLG